MTMIPAALSVAGITFENQTLKSVRTSRLKRFAKSKQSFTDFLSKKTFGS